MSSSEQGASPDNEAFRSLPRKRIGAGVVAVDTHGQVLLVEPTYKDYWEAPGGIVEPGESPRTCARREAREELGLDVTVGRLLVIDWVPVGFRPDDGLMLLYAVASFDTSQIVLPVGELRSWKWCDREAMKERVPDHHYR